MYNRHSGNDRRRFQRLKANLSVFYQVYSPLYLRSIFGQQETEAITLDISKGGMAFLSDKDIPLWSLLLIKIILFKTDKEGLVSFSDPVEIVGEVRSNTLIEDNKHRLGICFKAMDDDYRRDIDKFLEPAVNM